jgi:hypothetical protein
MKPAISVILLTLDEQAFISAVLAADVVPQYGKIDRAAAIIAASKPTSDGMVYEEADRDAMFHPHDVPSFSTRRRAGLPKTGQRARILPLPIS